MSGHSKWHNIQARKGKSDAQRGKIFTKIGREIGYHKKSCKIFNNERSHALEMVNNKYWDFIKKIGNNFNLRIRECFNPETNTKIGDLQQMVVNVTTKSTKNKNLNNEKLIIDNIYFDKFE